MKKILLLFLLLIMLSPLKAQARCFIESEPETITSYDLIFEGTVLESTKYGSKLLRKIKRHSYKEPNTVTRFKIDDFYKGPELPPGAYEVDIYYDAKANGPYSSHYESALEEPLTPETQHIIFASYNKEKDRFSINACGYKGNMKRYYTENSLMRSALEAGVASMSIDEDTETIWLRLKQEQEVLEKVKFVAPSQIKGFGYSNKKIFINNDELLKLIPELDLPVKYPEPSEGYREVKLHIQKQGDSFIWISNENKELIHTTKTITISKDSLIRPPKQGARHASHQPTIISDIPLSSDTSTEFSIFMTLDNTGFIVIPHFEPVELEKGCLMHAMRFCVRPGCRHRNGPNYVEYKLDDQGYLIPYAGRTHPLYPYPDIDICNAEEGAE